MALTNREKQEAYRARMRKAGYVQALVWVPKDKKAELKAFAEHLCSDFSSARESQKTGFSAS